MTPTDPIDGPATRRRLRPYSALPQGFLRRPEVMRLSDKARLLFWAMTDHACEQLTDGLIEDLMLPMLYAVTGADASALAALTAADLVKTTDGNYEIVDFLDYSRSREVREAARTNGRERVARHRARPEPPPPPPPVTRYETRDVTPPVTRVKHAQRERERETLEGGDNSSGEVTTPVTGLQDSRGQNGFQLSPAPAVVKLLTPVRLEEEPIGRSVIEILTPESEPTWLLEAVDDEAGVPEAVVNQDAADQPRDDVGPRPAFAVGDRIDTFRGPGEVTSCDLDAVYIRLDRDHSVHGFYPDRVRLIVPEPVA